MGEVRGAGEEEANGWYRRREHAEGPPCFLGTVWGHPSWTWSQSVWDREYKGQYWYENSNGYFIFLDVAEQGQYLLWKIRSNRNASLYVCSPQGSEKVPPTYGWVPNKHIVEDITPAPTLQVVNH